MIARRRDKALAVVVAAAAKAGRDLIQSMTKPVQGTTAAETAAELRERQPALQEAINAVDAEIATARADHERAFTAFVQDESDEHARELWLAEQRAKARACRRADLEAQFAALIGSLDLAERCELEQRMEAIDVELTDNRRAIELDAAATAAAARLVDTLLEIRAHNVSRERLRSEQQGLRERLGLPLVPAYSVRALDPSLLNTSVGLRELAQGEQDPVRRGYLTSLSHGQIEFRPA